MKKKIIKINPCPYCGGQAKIMTKTVNFCNDTVINFCVECPDCKAATEPYNTYFGTLCSDGRMRKMTEKEAILGTIKDWNNHNFNTQTRLLHMSDKERTLWWIEKLLSIAWYGAMISMGSPDFIAGWKLREIAENRELIKLHSEINYDLGEVAKVLFNDFRVKDIIYQFFEDRGSMLLMK